MMADYCWMLKKDAPQKESKKKKIPLPKSLSNSKECIIIKK